MVLITPLLNNVSGHPADDQGVSNRKGDGGVRGTIHDGSRYPGLENCGEREENSRLQQRSCGWPGSPDNKRGVGHVDNVLLLLVMSAKHDLDKIMNF